MIVLSTRWRWHNCIKSWILLLKSHEKNSWNFVCILHSSYIVLNTFHFDEIFSLQKIMKKFVKFCLISSYTLSTELFSFWRDFSERIQYYIWRYLVAILVVLELKLISPYYIRWMNGKIQDFNFIFIVHKIRIFIEFLGGFGQRQIRPLNGQTYWRTGLCSPWGHRWNQAQDGHDSLCLSHVQRLCAKHGQQEKIERK